LNRGLLVWHFYHTALADEEGGIGGILVRCGQALERLTGLLELFASNTPRLSGLLHVADLGRYATQLTNQRETSVALEPGPHLSRGGTVNALCLPPDVDIWQRFVPDLKEGFQLVIDELFREP
jgi:hypothetical protein